MIILLSALVIWGLPQNPQASLSAGLVRPVTASTLQADQAEDSPSKDIIPIAHGLRVERSSANVLVSPNDLVELAPPVSHEDWWRFVFVVAGRQEDKSIKHNPVFMFRPSADAASMTLLKVYGIDASGQEKLVQEVWVRTTKEAPATLAVKVKGFNISVNGQDIGDVFWYCGGKQCAYSKAVSGAATTQSLSFPSGRQTLQLVSSDSEGTVFEQDVPVVLEPAISFKVEGQNASDADHLRVNAQSHSLSLSAIASTVPAAVKSMELIVAGSPIASSTDSKVSREIELKDRAPGPVRIYARATYANGLVSEEEFTAQIASNAFFNPRGGNGSGARRGQ